MKLVRDFGVRALMGLLVLTPAIATLCYLAVKNSPEALVAIVAMSTAIVGFYFGTRSKA